MVDSLKACAVTGTRTLVAPSLIVCLGALLSSAPAMAQQTINITTGVAHNVCGNGNAGGLGSGNCGDDLGGDPDHFDLTEVTGNTVTVSGSAYSVYGAYNSGNTGIDRMVDGNRVTINVSSTYVDHIFGGYAADDSSGAAATTNNWVVFLDGSATNIVGGYSTSTNALSRAAGNRVEMSGGMLSSSVTGGEARSSNINSKSLSENNYVKISGDAQVNSITGGIAGNGDGEGSAIGNTVLVSGNANVGDITGGFATGRNAVATLNTVTMTGGTVGPNVGIVGGYAEGHATTGAATYNTVTITGGEVQNSIYAGVAVGIGGKAMATNNTVILAGTPNLTAASLFGGYLDAGDAGSDIFTGNTLQVKTTSLSIAGLSNFEFLTFYVPATATSGTTMLDVSGTADLSDGGSRSSTVGIFIEGSRSALQIGDQIILIDAASINGAPANTQTTAYGTQGATLQYDFELSAAANRLIATLSKVSAREESKSLSEGYLSSAAMLGQGSSFLVQQGMEAAREAIQNTSEPASDATRSTAVQEPLSLHTFGTFSGGKLRYNTGSHVDVEGYNLIAGVANGFRLNAGKEAMLAGFFEYGKGDYTSHNSFASGKVSGRGDTEYKGIGFIGRFDFDGAFYLEGSLRGGQAETNYRSSDLTNASGHGARYEAKNGYIGAHLGVGKTWKLGDKNTLDTYAQALWTRQGKDTVTLSTGDRVKFDEINSERLRVGARFSHTFLTNLSGYAGLAYDYEFAGKAKAEVNGHAVDAPSLKGGTGSLEVGVTSQPSANQPLYLSVGVQGHAGKREGATASFRINYFF